MFQAQGSRGRLLAGGYAVAGSFRAWSCVTGKTLGGFTTIEADGLVLHPVYGQARPLTVALDFGGHEWRWEAQAIRTEDGQLRARAEGAPVVFPLRRE